MMGQDFWYFWQRKEQQPWLRFGELTRENSLKTLQNNISIQSKTIQSLKEKAWDLLLDAREILGNLIGCFRSIDTKEH